MRTILALVLATAVAQWGDMPTWAESSRIYHSQSSQDYLGELVGCTLLSSTERGSSFQCGETFAFVGSRAYSELVLSKISNIQAEGHIKEARVFQGGAGTREHGRIDKAIVFNADCYGNVGECVGLRAEVVEFTNGWKFKAVGDGLELIGPDGTLRDKW